MKYTTLLIFLTLSLAVSCSQGKSKNVKISVSQFSSHFAALADYKAGGLMIWGQSTQGASFGRSLTEDSISLNLPLGTWTFYVMAWDGAQPLTGDMICGQTTATLSSDIASNVILEPNDDNCSSPLFTASLSAIPFTTCNDPAEISLFDLTCTKTTVEAYRVSLDPSALPGEDLKTVQGITSFCRTMDNSTINSDYLLMVPLGAKNTPFKTRIQFYASDDDCRDNINLIGNFNFINGVSQTGLRTDVKFFSVDKKLAFYIDGTPVVIGGGAGGGGGSCNPSGSPFGHGDGTSGNPFLICTEEQLLNFATSTSGMNLHYKLTANLDFTGYTKGSRPARSWDICVGPNDTFIPIGMSFSSCAPVLTPFTGTFDGDNHSVTGIKINFTSNYIGFFSEIQTTGKVFNLKLIKPEITGHNYVGALAGFINSDNSTSNAENITISQAKVTGQSFHLGTAIGLAYQAKLKKLFVDGSVEGTNASSYSIGGIAGNVSKTELVESRFEGFIKGQAYLGGLVGAIGDASTPYTLISSSYAHAVIESTPPLNSNVYAGGLVGSNSSTSPTIERSYFLGKIISSCTGGLSCEIFPVAMNSLAGNKNIAIDKTYINLINPDPDFNDTDPSIDKASSVFFSSSGNVPDSSLMTQLIGDYPRLTNEDHPCKGAVSVNDQITNGKGTAGNPIQLCNWEQVKEMKNFRSHHYKLIVPIFATESISTSWGDLSDGGVAGSLDMNGFGILGLNVEMSLGSWWKSANILNPSFPGATRVGEIVDADDISDLVSSSTLPSYTCPSDPRVLAGEGLPLQPYLICKPEDLYRISTYGLEKSYKLMNDLNLSLLTHDIGCWDDTSFIPIGVSTASCATSVPFTGTFDGGRYSITGLKIDMPSSSVPLGLFSRTDNAVIKDLTLEGPEINGDSYVGALSGSSEDGQFNYIFIKKAKIMATSHVGSAVGIANGSSFLEIFADGFIEGTAVNTYAGGVVGHLTGGNIYSSRFEGLVKGKTSLGGVAGAAGLASSTDISSSYAHGVIQTKLTGNNTLNMGGVVGRLLSGTIRTNYFFGKFIHSCDGGTFDCQVHPIAPISHNSNLIINHGSMNATTTDGISAFTNASILFTSGGSNPGGSSDYETFQTGDIPRLNRENHPCRLDNAYAQVSTQMTSRGSGPQPPILVCHWFQINSMIANYNLNFKLVNYVLAYEDMNDNAIDFSGTLDGDGYAIMGFNLNEANTSLGWWNNIFGNFTNLNFYAPSRAGNLISDPDDLALLLSSGTIPDDAKESIKLEYTPIIAPST